jgi:hypothetical protein
VLTDNSSSVLNLNRVLGDADNSTSLSSLGLGFLNLNVNALVNDTSCPGGGLLNPLLNLGDTCLGAQVITTGNIANLCVQQPGGCCCSPGDSPPLLPLVSPKHHKYRGLSSSVSVNRSTAIVAKPNSIFRNLQTSSKRALLPQLILLLDFCSFCLSDLAWKRPVR